MVAELAQGRNARGQSPPNRAMPRSLGLAVKSSEIQTIGQVGGLRSGTGNADFRIGSRTGVIGSCESQQHRHHQSRTSQKP